MHRRAMKHIFLVTILSIFTIAVGVLLAQDAIGTITGEGKVNVVDEPGSVFGIVTAVEAGDSVDVLGQSEDGEWIFIRLIQGTRGWIRADRIDITGDIPALPADTSSGPTPVFTPDASPEATGEPTSRPTGAPAVATDVPADTNDTADRTISLGFTADSGADSSNSSIYLNGITLALKDRPTVTIDGKTFDITLSVQDTQCDPDRFADAVDVWIDDPTVAGVIGPECTALCDEAIRLPADANMTPFISGSCYFTLGTASESNVFSRVISADTDQMRLIAYYLIDQSRLTSVALVQDESPYGQFMGDVFTSYYTSLGGTVSDTARTDDPAGVQQLLTGQAALGDVTVVFAGEVTGLSSLLDQVSEAAVGTPTDVFATDVAFFDTDTMLTAQIIAALGGESDVPDFHLYGAAQLGFMAKTPAAVELDERYFDLYGSDFSKSPTYFERPYDVVNILLDAIETTASLDGDGNLQLDRVALNEAIKTTSYDGVTGSLECNGSGECARHLLNIHEVSDPALPVIFAGTEVDPPATTDTSTDSTQDDDSTQDEAPPATGARPAELTEAIDYIAEDNSVITVYYPSDWNAEIIDADDEENFPGGLTLVQRNGLATFINVGYVPFLNGDLRSVSSLLNTQGDVITRNLNGTRYLRALCDCESGELYYYIGFLGVQQDHLLVLFFEADNISDGQLATIETILSYIGFNTGG